MILLVEDDLVTSHILAALLKRLRYPHVLARTGAQALECVATQPVDLIIADLGLPDMNGIDLLEQIVVRPHLQDVPFLVCTADTSAKTVERALGAGAVDFVKKPISVDDFAARVTRALKRAPARWERWPDVIRRLRVDQRAYEPLLAIARDELRELVQALAQGEDAGALVTLVARVRGAALNVGATRTVQLLDLLWTPEATARDVEDLHAALVIELGAVEQMVSARRYGGDDRGAGSSAAYATAR